MRRPRLRGLRRLFRVPRPSPHRLGAAVTLLGLMAGVAILVVPVDAAFADDPLLRYGRFAGSEPSATDIECGAPVTNLLRRSADPGFYSAARDGACRDAASRRAATALAATGVIGVLGLIRVTSAAERARA